MDDPWPAVFTTILALVLTAAFSGLGSIGISRTTLERLHEEKIARAGLYLWLYRSRDFVSQMVLLGQTIAISTGTLALLSLFFQPPIAAGFWQYLGAVWSVALYVFLALVIRSIVPPYRREEGSDRPLPFLPICFLPLYCLLVLPTLLLQKAQTVFLSEDDSRALKEEELRNIVESETEEGTIEAEEREMIEGIFGFGETTVKEVMIPRIDMISSEITATPKELLELIQQSWHSRIPIYEGRIDNIKGVVYVKDILLNLATNRAWSIPEIMRAPYFVPETKTIDVLMAEFKREKVHMAIVVGEYGGTSGLITMEDIIEEIVGEIQDEYDDEEPLFEWREEGKILIADARIDIEDLNDVLHVELPQEGYETLGGFIFSALEHVPQTGENLEHGHLLIEILEVVGQRITRVKISKLGDPLPRGPESNSEEAETQPQNDEREK